ncbi:GAF domain-containing protein [Bremerella cremea]|uniref:GAF domain-containing protein n=1 Tax=Bremerella cremea TaxID=1031537 RepID=A0A368KUW8_9BACT|nr:SpoIIE family protein phosphatase [Bremerella cremea]RCS51836.1 GAF domain-containing protein [Bremerella cremea]
MPRPIPDYLRVHREESPVSETAKQEAYPGLTQISQALANLTGFRLALREERQPNKGKRMSQQQVTRGGNTARIELHAAEKQASSAASDALTAESMGGVAGGLEFLLAEIDRLRITLRKQEAELATHIPVIANPSIEDLAERLEAALASAVDVTGADAAGLYVLDDATSQLKLRASHNLPATRLLDPPRPLEGSLADLEALSGHAVVLEDTKLLPHWPCPEEAPSAVCIPISTSTTPLGTLWVYSQTSRDFSLRETNLLEIIAGKLAVDLERDQLISERRTTQKLARQKNQIADRQKAQLPNVKPLVDGWDVSAWTQQGNDMGGDFHDWAVIEDGKLAIFVGDAMDDNFDAVMTSTSLATAVKANCRIAHNAEMMLDRVNRTFWEASAGDHFASLAYAIFDPMLGTMEAGSCGHVQGFAFKHNSVKPLWNPSWPLGSSPEVEPQLATAMLQPGETLALLSSGLSETLEELDGKNWQAKFCDLIVRHMDLPTDRIMRAVQERLNSAAIRINADKTLVLVKRKNDH